MGFQYDGTIGSRKTQGFPQAWFVDKKTKPPWLLRHGGRPI
jgi:hypothetical protein